DVGKEVPDLVHQVDAQVGVVDPDVDVHPADDEAAGDLLEVGGQPGVPGLVGVGLVPPLGEGVGGGGDDGGAVALDDRSEVAPQPSQVGVRLLEGAARASADLRSE